MKILQVMAGGRRGGAETAFVDMCIALHEAGEDVAVVTRANDLRVPRLKDAGLTVHTIPFGGKLDIYSRWALRNIIKNFKPDIVQSWMSRASQFVPRWEVSMNIPQYLTVARLGNYYKFKNFKSIDYFVAISPKIKTYLLGEGVSPDHVRQINNFAETGAVKEFIDRNGLGVPDDGFLVLGLGRLHDAKAFDVLIKAVSKLDNVYLWIAGEGPERATLESLIQTLGLDDRVRLLGWREDRAALFVASDLCVFSSRYEPFGTVFVQAWAHAVPLVSTKSDGPAQFVCDGEDGILVDIDDVDQMAGAIAQVRHNPGLQKSLISRGLERYRADFTKDECVKNYLAWYHDIRARHSL